MHKHASSKNISVAQVMKLMLATNILVLSFAVPVAAGSLEDGRAAYEHRDFAIAERLFRPLAEHGNAIAEYNLGVMYYKGEGVPQDYILAHMWLSLAAAKNETRAVDLRDIVATKMTAAQVAEAQKLGREWKPTK